MAGPGAGLRWGEESNAGTWVRDPLGFTYDLYASKVGW
jgi:hypothetical protein